MSAPLFSIVMPVYNVAAYLPRCLDSLAVLHPAPDEIIAVDDGSTDTCPAILADYAQRMPNLKIIRQENGGLSAARNTGMSIARGRYLAFVDSDDFVAPDIYAPMLAAAQADDLDMVVTNAWYHFEERASDRTIYADLTDSGVVTGRDWLAARLQKQKLLHMVWMHLYRRDFLEQHKLRFVPRLIHEDVLWTTRALLLAKRLRCLPQAGYFYRIPIRRYTPEQNKKRLEALITSSEYNARELAQMLPLAQGNRPLEKLLRWQLVDGAMSVFHKIEQLPDRADRRAHYRRLRDNGFYRLLWRMACSLRQHRRVASQYLRRLST